MKLGVGIALLLTLICIPAASETRRVEVPGNANLWLAGMPNGTKASRGDKAPDQSPVLVAGLPLEAIGALNIRASGRVAHGGGLAPGPDGVISYPIHHYPGPQNGISGAKAPIDSLVGVFLSEGLPTETPNKTQADFAAPKNTPGTARFIALNSSRSFSSAMACGRMGPANYMSCPKVRRGFFSAPWTGTAGTTTLARFRSRYPPLNPPGKPYPRSSLER